MRITHFEVQDFRNIVRANVDFGKVNIITGKNSSGKSNFLLALTHALSLDKDYSKIFNDNIVTYQPGKSHAIFRTTLGDIDQSVLFRGGDKFIYISSKEFRFEKIIEKKTAASKSHKLFFTGSVAEMPAADLKNFEDQDLFAELAKQATAIKDKEVYSEKLSQNIEAPNTKVVNIDSGNVEHQDKYRILFSDYISRVKSWMGNFSFSSNLIYQFVTTRPNNDVYEQVVEYLKSENKRRHSLTPFDKSQFIFLVADIQKDEKLKSEYQKDLALYTRGIVNDVSISVEGRFGNKGEMLVDSPQGPKDVHTLSTGTAVLLYFITLKNWLKANHLSRSYEPPAIMIFDEVESILHPSLMEEFCELIRSISQNIQLFVSTHSPRFIDYFEKSEVFLLKDTPSLPGPNGSVNRCNIYSFEEIIKSLPEKRQPEIMETPNSELFIDATIDLIFPSHD